jgi:type II secretory ATPase GspE/PulE/Tfp pilus assembly ATPase PilB-like protein
MSETSAVVRLVNAILLSALKKQAQTIQFRAGSAHEGIVEFKISGVIQEELRPPAKPHDAVIRRLAIMANLPAYKKGGSAIGTIQLLIGEDKSATFGIVVEGHGAERTALLTVLR